MKDRTRRKQGESSLAAVPSRSRFSGTEVLVFDFDKTLTYKDSFTQLCCRRMHKFTRWWVFPVWVILKISSKIGFISVKKEKELCLRLLFPHHISEYISVCQDFSSHIELTPIVNRLKQAYAEGNRIIILSASPREYIQLLFTEVEVYAMETKVDFSGKILGINQHPYNEGKLNVLLEKGITHIDEMFYDSKSDEVLIPLSDVWHKVTDGVIAQTFYSH